MNIKKIQLTKTNTLNVVYSNGDGDTINMVGANIVHRDLKEAVKELVPHLVHLTEQKESKYALIELQAQRDIEVDSVFTRINVESICIDDNNVSLGGTRILNRGDVIRLSSPKINTTDDEYYPYLSELSLAVEAVKYEAEQYVKEKKWGLKEESLNFEDDNPFSGDVKPDEVPQVTVELVHTGKKKNKKEKKAV